MSDTCAKNEKIDESSTALKQLIDNIYNTKEGKVICFETVPDEAPLITKVLTQWSNEKKANVILTTGGTGFSNRDVTPEATKSVIHKEAPGLSVAMLMSSIKITPMAMLSR